MTDPPQDSIEVVIEIPTGSRNKYEYDHEHHVIRLDRRLFTATTYPADYGFVPDTLAGDGDPLDVLVLVADPTFPGCVVRVRILGMFSMRDEKGVDAKLITVLEHDPQWDDAHDIEDVPRHLRNEIAHFFSIYKDSSRRSRPRCRGTRTGPPRWPSSRPAGRPTAPSSASTHDREGPHAVSTPTRSRRPSTATTSCAGGSTTDSSPTPSAPWPTSTPRTPSTSTAPGDASRAREAIARWLVDSMVGMEDWKFPVEFTAIEGDDVVVKWTQIMPRTRPDGTPYRQSGYSRLIYAGDGKFSYEEDTYNMAHVLEDIEASGWQPTGP